MPRRQAIVPTTGPAKRSPARLSRSLRPLFWDHDFAQLRWEKDQDLIVRRVLSAGSWDAVRWLYRQLGPAALRLWLIRCRGAGLSPRQLRYWEVVLPLPRRTVNAWLAEPARRTWDRRCHA
jgi:hypothetical protein